jgi:hypothetical protein
VPLSENEQRQLEAIERALYSDDPKFAAALNGGGLRSLARRRLIAFGFLALVGAVLLCLTFLHIAFGLAGVLVMFVGVLGVVGATRQLTGRSRSNLGVVGVGGAVRHHPRRRTGPSHVTWRARIDQRWQRRWNDRGL